MARGRKAEAMPNPKLSEGGMNNTEYWKAIAQWGTLDLTPEEWAKYKLAGLVCESKARASGSSIIPCSYPESALPVEQIPESMLVLIGITIIRMSKLKAEESVNNG